MIGSGIRFTTMKIEIHPGTPYRLDVQGVVFASVD
jgi:hypothetical protein